MKKAYSLFMITLFIVGLFPATVFADEAADQALLTEFTNSFEKDDILEIGGADKTISNIYELNGQKYYTLTEEGKSSITVAVYSKPDSQGDPTIRLQVVGTNDVYSSTAFEQELGLFYTGEEATAKDDGDPPTQIPSTVTAPQLEKQIYVNDLNKEITTDTQSVTDKRKLIEQLETERDKLDSDDPAYESATTKIENLEKEIETLENSIDEKTDELEDAREELNALKGTTVTPSTAPPEGETQEQKALRLNTDLQTKIDSIKKSQLEQRTELTQTRDDAQGKLDEQLESIKAQINIAELTGGGDVTNIFYDVLNDDTQSKQEKRDGLRQLLAAELPFSDQQDIDNIINSVEIYLNQKSIVDSNNKLLAALDDEIANDADIQVLKQQRDAALIVAFPSIDPILLTSTDYSDPKFKDAFNKASSEDLAKWASAQTEQQLEDLGLELDKDLKEDDTFAIGSTLSDLQGKLKSYENQISPTEQEYLDLLNKDKTKLTNFGYKELGTLNALQGKFSQDQYANLKIDELGSLIRSQAGLTPEQRKAADDKLKAEVDKIRSQLTPEEQAEFDKLVALEKLKRDAADFESLNGKKENGTLDEEELADMERLRRQIAIRQAERAKEIEDIQTCGEDETYECFATLGVNILSFAQAYLGWYNKFSGLGRVASLFIEDDDIYGIKDEVHDYFCKSVLLGDPSCRFQALCEKHPDHMTGGNIIISGVNTKFQAGAHLQAYIYPPSLSLEDEIDFLDETEDAPRLLSNQELRDKIREERLKRRQKPERTYLVTYTLSLTEKDDDQAYNLVFYGPNGKNYKLFRNPKQIQAGGSDSRGPQNPFVQSSKEIYDKVCLEFTKGIKDFRGENHRNLCVPIVLKSGEAPRQVQKKAEENTQRPPPGEQSGF